MRIKSEIISHCQSEFNELMKLDGISPEHIKASLLVDKNRQMVFKAGEGAGASGSFFFFSHDNRFLIKTL
jgi:1-phosphatidylinositol-4-phosphate 5-kinase